MGHDAGVLAGAAAGAAILLAVIWIRREAVHPHIGNLVYIMAALIGALVFASSLAGSACALALLSGRPISKTAAVFAGGVSAALSMAVQFTLRLGSPEVEMLLLVAVQAAGAALCSAVAVRWSGNSA